MTKAAHELCTIALVALLTFSNPILAQSQFTRYAFPPAVSILLPQNWSVIAARDRNMIDAEIASAGLAKVPSALSFAARHLDYQGQVTGTVEVRSYPDNLLTQTSARSLNAASIALIDQTARQSLSASGVEVTQWYGSRVEVINGIHALVQKYRYQHPESGSVQFRSVRVWAYPKSFTLSLSYRERDQEMMAPVIQQIQDSLRFE